MLYNMFGLLSENSIVIPNEDGTLNALSLASPTPSALIIILTAALGLVSVALIVIILLQKKRASGIGTALGGTGETYWAKNKAKSPEGSLERYTKIGAAALMIIGLLINMFI